MKKLLLSLFIFSYLIIGVDCANASELKCVYEYQKEKVIISADNNKLSVSASNDDGSINVRYDKITIENFRNSNGSLECLNTLYIEKVYGSRKLDYYQIKTLNDGYSANIKFNLNSKESNWPEDTGESKFINVCSYDNNFIKKTEDKLLFDFPSFKYDSIIGIKYNDMPSDSCPEYIYYKCTDRTESCEVSFNKKSGWSKIKKDYDIPNSDNLNNPKDNFKTLLQALKTPAQAFDNSNISDKSILSYELQLNGNKITLASIDGNDNVCKMDECLKNPIKNVETAVMNIKDYCNYVYVNDAKNDTRVSDCYAFENFYDNLVKDEILKDLTIGCDLISSRIQDVLDKMLFAIQVAGPILAIILGSLDFIKVIFNGDPDKELKEAFKKFKVRLIAAALLFLIPMFLSTGMNLILRDEENYDSNNPFCEIGD